MGSPRAHSTCERPGWPRLNHLSDRAPWPSAQFPLGGSADEDAGPSPALSGAATPDATIPALGTIDVGALVAACRCALAGGPYAVLGAGVGVGSASEGVAHGGPAGCRSAVPGKPGRATGGSGGSGGSRGGSGGTGGGSSGRPPSALSAPSRPAPALVALTVPVTVDPGPKTTVAVVP